MTKVEEVAKAIFEAWAKEEGSDATWAEVCEMTAKDGYPNAKKWHRMALAEARAAIAAMRPATDAMKCVGGLKCEALMFEGEGSGVIFDDMGVVFTAMINEALREDAQ